MNKNSKFIHSLKWLYPGMRMKRWIFIFIAGIFEIAISVPGLLSATSQIDKIINISLLIFGLGLVYIGASRMLRTVIGVFLPHKEKDLVDIMYKKMHLIKGPRIVAVGGGTGLAVLLEGLKEYTSNITAIVTVADSGGSSGRLREQFDILPPGDIRNCLVALADAGPLMQKLFQFRFTKNSEFQGHNFGNLFITAMTQLTGDFEKAIKESSKVLAIRGQVIPSTLEKVSLVAEYQDGSFTEGEAEIPKNPKPIKKLYLKPGDAKPTLEVLRAIEEAEIIILGPGSLYTSVIPNLLIGDITDALARSNCPRIYVCNVMTQQGETDGYQASDHIHTLRKHSRNSIITHCIVNKSSIPDELLARYKEEGSFPVANDIENIRKLGYEVIEGDFISAADFVRHDSKKLTQIIIDFIEREHILTKTR